jgi:drug/metabolite transporter (DMT)-like permease
MLFWGMSFVWTAILLRHYEPITIIVLRLMISTIVLLLWLKLFGEFQKIKKKDYKVFILSALLNPFFYFIGENYGVKLTSPTVSAVIIATIPLFVPIVAYFSLKEKLSWLNVLGLLVSFGGVLIILLRNDLSFEFSSLGIFALFFAVVSAVGYTIFLKKLTLTYNPIFIIAIQNMLGFLFFLPFFFTFELDQFLSVVPNTEMIVSLLALAIFCSSLAYVGFTIAMRDIGVSKANVFANLIPVFTGVFSYFVIGEELNTQKILGIFIVVGGLFVSQIRKSTGLAPLNRY